MPIDEAMELDGKRIVVVEDDFLLAADICRELRILGATVLGPAPTPFYAMQLLNRKRIDVAILDVNLHGKTVFEFADRLQFQGVPILFATAFAHEDLPKRFQGARLIEKPLRRAQLLAEIRELTCRPEHRVAAAPGSTLMGHRAPSQAFARAVASRWPMSYRDSK